jgi:hypothetical protein
MKSSRENYPRTARCSFVHMPARPRVGDDMGHGCEMRLPCATHSAQAARPAAEGGVPHMAQRLCS